jgi:hypothetical protein
MPGNPPGYSASYAERERLHLRQETYFGRRTSQSSLVPAILEPVKRLVSTARLKWDTAYYQRQQGRLPVTKPWKWEQAKSQTGFDDRKPLTVLAHAWECWGFWLEVFRRPKNGDHRYLTASVLARRALRGWRRWTIQEKLLAPTWQQVRLNARLLPPLPTSTGSTRPRTRTAAPRAHEMGPLATYYYGASPWVTSLQEHEERAQVTSSYDEWRSAQDSLLQEFDRLHPGRVWLRSWLINCNLVNANSPRWYQFLQFSSKYPPYGQLERASYRSRPPPKLRCVLCHYGQPYSWHLIEATPACGPRRDGFQETEWQESVLFTTAGSCQGSIRWASMQTALSEIQARLAELNVTGGKPGRQQSHSDIHTWRPADTVFEPSPWPMYALGRDVYPSFSPSTDLDPAHPSPCNETTEDHCDFDFDSAHSLTEDSDFSDAESVASRLEFQEHRLLRRSWYSWRYLTEGNRRSGKGWDPFNRIPASEVPANQWQTDLASIVRQPNSLFGQPKRSTRTRSPTFSYWESRRGHPLRRPIARSVVQPIVHRPGRSTRTTPAKCATKRGRRQHRQELRQARANRKADRNELSRPARSVVQPSSVFVFTPLTAPAFKFTVPATSGVFVFGRSTLTGMEFSPSSSSSSSFSTFSALSTLSINSTNLTNSTSTHQRSARLGPDQLWGATQSTTLESDTKIDRVAGQSSSLSLTAARINQRPRQLHDVSPHVSLLHQIAGSEPARGLKPRGASHRPDPLLMSTSLYSTPTFPSSGAALVGAGEGEAPHTHSLTSQREREAILHHTPDLSALDDSSLDDSERASAASTIPMLTALLSFWLARRADRPRQRGRKARDLKRGTAHGQLVHFLSSGTESGEHHRQPRRHGSRCTRALMKTLGRSKWLNGLCRCLHSGCTDGTGPSPSIEP